MQLLISRSPCIGYRDYFFKNLKKKKEKKQFTKNTVIMRIHCWEIYLLIEGKGSFLSSHLPPQLWLPANFVNKNLLAVPSGTDSPKSFDDVSLPTSLSPKMLIFLYKIIIFSYEYYNGISCQCWL